MTRPLRTCCLCGMKKPKESLYRFVWQDGRPAIDYEQVEQGRGAYCCRNDRCKQGFLSMKKKWKRVFRLFL